MQQAKAGESYNVSETERQKLIEKDDGGNDGGDRFVTVQTTFTTEKHLHILIVYI